MLSATVAAFLAVTGQALTPLDAHASTAAPVPESAERGADGSQRQPLPFSSLWWLLTAPDGQSHDEFARAVALDGNTAVVGVPYEDYYSSPGVAYVFVRSGGTWALQATLTAADGADGEWFGASVAVSGDTIVVGAPRHPWGQNATGSAYVFTRSGSTWSQRTELTADDAANGDFFGGAAALDGSTAVIGAGSANAAYVFTGSGASWSQQSKLTGDGSFGTAVAVTGDTAIVGAQWWGSAGGVNDPLGAAFVFVRSGTTWTQQARLTAADGEHGDYFGASVALSGETALVGRGQGKGAAYVYTRSGSAWSQQAKLQDPGSSSYPDCFGTSVALVGDTALVGSPYTDFTYGNDSQGAAYLFARSGTTWTQQAMLTASDSAAGDSFGYAAAMSGSTALIGAPTHDVAGHIDQGSAYALQLDNHAPHTTIGLAPAANAAGWNRGPVTVTLIASDVGSGVDTTYVRSGTGGYAQYVDTAKPVVSANGTTDIWYYSTDLAGNAETPAKATVSIDTTRPATEALGGTRVRRGRAVTLRMRVNDSVSPRAQVTVRIYRSSVLRKTLRLGLRSTNSDIGYRYLCRLAKGRYVWKVYATDLAGNTQSQIGRSTLRVR